MGILAEDLIEQSNLTIGSLFEVEKIHMSNCDFKYITGWACGLYPMLIGNPRKNETYAAFGELPIAPDHKGRPRPAKDALIDWVLGLYSIQYRKQMTNPRISTSSTATHLYISIESDYEFETGYDTYKKNLLMVTLKIR